MSVSSPTPPANRPLWSFGALAVFVLSLTVLYATGKDSGAGIYIALVAANLPTLVAAIASEQAARDIRNGTVARKAKEGATAAIQETGVLVRTGPVAQAQLAASAANTAALNATLARLHTLTAENATKLDAIEQHTAAVADTIVDNDGGDASD